MLGQVSYIMNNVLDWIKASSALKELFDIL